MNLILKLLFILFLFLILKRTPEELKNIRLMSTDAQVCVYEQYAVKWGKALSLPADQTDKDSMLENIYKKVYNVSTMPAGAVCSAQIVNGGNGSSSIMIGFTCDKVQTTFADPTAKIFIYVYSSVADGDTAKNYLKAWRIKPEYYANSKFVVPATTYNTHGLTSQNGSEVLLGCKGDTFYLPKKSYFLEGRHEDILENQVTSYLIESSNYACYEKTTA